MPFNRALTWTGLAVGASALALQFGLSIPAYLETGAGLGRALVMFFSYFTILTNIVLVLIYLVEITQTPRLGVFRRPVTWAMMAAAILLVMLFYHVMIAPHMNWQGWWKVADTALHYVAPVLYLVWWVRAVPHGQLAARNVPAMVAPLLVYLPYALFIGALTGAYPYAILDLTRLGYAQVALNSAFVAAGLVALCLVAVWLDRRLAR